MKTHQRKASTECKSSSEKRRRGKSIGLALRKRPIKILIKDAFLFGSKVAEEAKVLLTRMPSNETSKEGQKRIYLSRIDSVGLWVREWTLFGSQSILNSFYCADFFSERFS